MTSPLHLEEIVRILPGKGDEYLERLPKEGVPLMERAGLKLMGAWQVHLAMREFLLIWRVEDAQAAFPDDGWLAASPNVQPQGSEWLKALDALVEDVQGTLMQMVPIMQPMVPAGDGQPPRRRLWFHEIQQVLPGQMVDYLGRLATEALPMWNASGWRTQGIFRSHHKPRELRWLVSYDMGRGLTFEPAVWINPDLPLPELSDWMGKAIEWRQDWFDRLMVSLPFSPM